MKNYIKPEFLMNEDLNEGVYAASGGAAASDCWTVDSYIHQTPETGRHDYRLQINAWHNNPAPSHRSYAIVTIVFNQSVTISSYGSTSNGGQSQGTSIQVKIGPGTSNPNESVGLGDLYVTSDGGLEIVSVGIQCAGK